MDTDNEVAQLIELARDAAYDERWFRFDRLTRHEIPEALLREWKRARGMPTAQECSPYLRGGLMDTDRGTGCTRR